MNHCIRNGASSPYGVCLLAVRTGSGIANSTLPWAIGLRTKKYLVGLVEGNMYWTLLDIVHNWPIFSPSKQLGMPAEIS